MNTADLRDYRYDEQAEKCSQSPVLNLLTYILLAMFPVSMVGGIVLVKSKDLPPFMVLGGTIVVFISLVVVQGMKGSRNIVCSKCRKPMERVDLDYLNANKYLRLGGEVTVSESGRTYITVRSSAGEKRTPHDVELGPKYYDRIRIQQSWALCKKCKRCILLQKVVQKLVGRETKEYFDRHDRNVQRAKEKLDRG